jgi:beta-glucosidase
MKRFLLSVMALIVISAANAETSPIVPMPSEFPDNIATYPFPKDVAWMKRVKLTNETAQKKEAEIKLVFDGDSITDGWQSRGKQVWQERYAQYGAFDFGISGDQTQHVLWRLLQGQAKGLNPKLIAIMIGTNNLGGCKNEQIAEGVKAIVEEYRKICPNAVILLQGIFPRGNKAEDPNRQRIKDINKEIAKLDDGSKVIFIDFGDKFLEADGTLSPDIMPDFLHPNEKGYKIWADAIQPVIDKYLK